MLLLWYISTNMSSIIVLIIPLLIELASIAQIIVIISYLTNSYLTIHHFHQISPHIPPCSISRSTATITRTLHLQLDRYYVLPCMLHITEKYQILWEVWPMVQFPTVMIWSNFGYFLVLATGPKGTSIIFNVLGIRTCNQEAGHMIHACVSQAQVAQARRLIIISKPCRSQVRNQIRRSARVRHTRARTQLAPLFTLQ